MVLQSKTKSITSIRKGQDNVTFIRKLQVGIDLRRRRTLASGFLAPFLEQLIELLIGRHLSGPSPFGLVLRLLELLEQVPPFICTHGGRAIVPFLPHLRRDLLPQMLVRLGSVEQTINLSPERDEAPRLLLRPCLRPLLGRLDLVVVAAALRQNHLLLLRLWRRQSCVVTEVNATGLVGQVHALPSRLPFRRVVPDEVASRREGSEGGLREKLV